MTVKDYAQSVRALRPDITVAMGDVAIQRTVQNKRFVRAAERTETWVDELLGELQDEPPTSIFAPVLEVPYPLQWEYLTVLLCYCVMLL